MRNRPASTLRRPLAASVLVGAVGLLASASPAMAGFKDCSTFLGIPAPAPILQGNIGSPIEGMVVDRSGRLWVTDLLGGKIIRFDRPGASGTVVATIPGGGGGALELLPDGTVIVGSGADPRVLFGDVLKPGAISTVDPVTGTLTPLAKGFSAANGFAVTRDGTIFATNDFASLIGKRAPDGTITTKWASLPSANGAALDKAQKYLYVSRTFFAPGVTRIPIDNPSKPERVLTLQGTDVFAAPDGLTLDSKDRPIVPTNNAGEIIRIDAPEKACRLAKGLPNSSVVAYGKGSVGFSKGRLFRAGFDGKVYEVPAAFDPGA
ncbi:MAG: hypothetical protein Q7T55_24515 [Solirubrobacteraceae bacterium]|nr:hypothetical protein [Solirubrobacteraceae bacterium]